MAGHSKWAQIKRTKAVKDAKRGANFAKMAKDIMVATRLGGPDPAGNFRLRTAIDKAKADGMPNDNIQRAIDKGAGVGEADNQEAVTYEGYGPGGVAILIETLTENRHRTAGDIRSYFNKYQGNLGTDGCVSWIFQERGVIRIGKQEMDEESLLELALEAGAEDMMAEDDTDFEILTTPEQLDAVCRVLGERGLHIVSAEASRVPQNAVHIADPVQAKPLLKLLETLENHDDVQAVYANLELADSVLSVLTT
ncbi:MAG: YebC/PmpR family DNA-binding transcriptional regulator [Candidatus Melainabacteria bacterium]|nr:YebC/PmpR family DNA-binding transcriptional regulator [Candidatus Melainabacteria bacterium]